MFGQRLRLARKKAGLSMQGLADRTSPRITAQAISKYEADKMNPSSSVLVGLSKALGVSLDFLMGGQVEELVGGSGLAHHDQHPRRAVLLVTGLPHLGLDERVLVRDERGDLLGTRLLVEEDDDRRVLCARRRGLLLRRRLLLDAARPRRGGLGSVVDRGHQRGHSVSP